MGVPHGWVVLPACVRCTELSVHYYWRFLEWKWKADLWKVYQIVIEMVCLNNK